MSVTFVDHYIITARSFSIGQVVYRTKNNSIHKHLGYIIEKNKTVHETSLKKSENGTQLFFIHCCNGVDFWH